MPPTLSPSIRVLHSPTTSNLYKAVDGAQEAVIARQGYYQLSHVPSPEHQVPSKRAVATKAAEGILKASSCLVEHSVYAGMSQPAS